jgi:hypothetical protein
MRFCPHVPNSTRNKNVKSSKPYLRPKMVFLAPKTVMYLSGTMKKNFLFDFERTMKKNFLFDFEPHDLTNGKE